MKGNNKVLSLVLTIYVIIILGIVVFNLIEPLIYNKSTSGKKTTSDNVYTAVHAIVAKKYEIILYESPKEISNIFSYNCKSKLKKFENSNIENKLLKEFVSFQITNIEEKGSIYIVYYNEQFEDGNINENKMIIKYRKNKAVIYYDSILEANYV